MTLDQLLNPTLIIGIGDFGGRVAESLEKQARDLADLWGYDAVRNLATLRIQTVAELRQTQLRGTLDGLKTLTRSNPGEPGRCEFARFKAIWLDPATNETPVCAESPDANLFDFKRAYRGFDPDDHTGFSDIEHLLKEALVDLIRALFQVEEFVEFHPDFNEFSSRLDVYVVGRFDCTSDADVVGGEKAKAERAMAHFLEEHVHCAVLDALSELARGPLSALFRPHESNLAITHVAALPILEAGAAIDSDHARARGRRTFARYIRRRHEAWDRNGWYIPGRFVVVEDRSFRYVLNEEQLRDQIQQFISLLTFRRRGAPLMLRDLVQPLPDIDRSRSPIEHITRLCGAFSTAVGETPVDDLIRYCRTKQAIGVGNQFLDRRKDERYTGDIDPNDKYVPPEALTPQIADEVYQMYGPSARSGAGGGIPGARADFSELEDNEEGYWVTERETVRTELYSSGLSETDSSLASDQREYALSGGTPGPTPVPRENVEDLLDAELDQLRRGLDEEIDAVIRGRFGLGQWELPTDIEAWMHQDRVVSPFHPDLDEVMLEDDEARIPNPWVPAGSPSTTNQLNQAWLDRRIKAFYDAAAFIIENKARDIFIKVEQNVQQRCQEWINLQQSIVDERVDASPAGWRAAHASLEAAGRLIDKRIEKAKEALAKHTFEPLPPKLEKLENSLESKLGLLMSAVDSKPIYQRSAWTAISLGLAWGVGLGAILAFIAPLAIGNVALTIVPAVLLMTMLSWYWIGKANAVVVQEINTYIHPETGSIPKALNEGKDKIFLVKDKKSWFGQRIEWSVLLWKLRFWRRLRLKLGNDLICLSDVGTSIENGVRGYRDDQQDLKVRFYEEQSRWLEENERLFSDDTQFMHSMADSVLADQLFDEYGADSSLFADQYQDEIDPMDNWRDQPPMADRADLQVYCRAMFEAIEKVDFLRDPEYLEVPQSRMRSFLNDYAYKLSLLTESSMVENTSLSSMSTYVVTHPENMEVLEKLAPAENWPGPWTLEPHPTNRHFVAFLRHAQGLTPWEMPIFGSIFDHLKTLVALEAFDTVAAVLGRIQNPAARKLTSAYVLQTLSQLPPVERPSDRLQSEPPAPVNARMTPTVAPNEIGPVAPESEHVEAVSNDPVAPTTEAADPAAGEDVPLENVTDEIEQIPLVEPDKDMDSEQFALEEQDDDTDSEQSAREDALAEEAATKVEAARAAFAIQVVEASTGDLNARFHPVDVQHLLPAESASSWMAAFVGDPQLIEIAAVLYGTLKDPKSKVEPASVEVRRTAIVNAADGQIPLAYKAVKSLPEEWRDETLIHRLHGDLVRSTIDRIPFGIAGVGAQEVENVFSKVLRIADHVHPWTLRSRTILNNAVHLFQLGRPEEAVRMLELDRVPDSARPKGPTLETPEVDELISLASQLGNSTALVTNLLNCYGEGSEFADEIPADLTRVMLELHPLGRPGLLELVSGYPAGCLSSKFVGAIEMAGAQ